MEALLRAVVAMRLPRQQLKFVKQPPWHMRTCLASTWQQQIRAVAARGQQLGKAARQRRLQPRNR